MKKHILIVDDEAQILRTAAKTLEKAGYYISTADNAESGLRVFRKQKFDLVISDYSMGEMNGIKFLLKIKDIAPGIKTILMSGAPGLEDRIPSTIECFIEKPIDVIEFRKTVISILNSNSE